MTSASLTRQLEQLSLNSESPWAPLPTDEGNTSIRLIRFRKRRRKRTHISISMHVVPLAEAPPFYALSYCWGTEAASQTISSNGHRLLVTPNLYTALQRLKRSRYKYLWIDAICINQGDTLEKNHQVNMMGQIYTAARAVLVWLGPGHETTDLAIRRLRQMYRIYGLYPYVKEADEFSIWGRDLEALGLPKWKDELPVDLEALCHMCMLPWFNRLWCVQEICLARRAYCLWGNACVDWEILVYGMEAVRKLDVVGNLATLLGVEALRYRQLEWTRNILHDFEQGKLGELLASHRNTQSQNDLDRVYALGGIITRLTSRSTQPLSIIPDYSTDFASVYTKLSLELLHRASDLNFLYDLRMPDSEPLDALPSWVPDWRATKWQVKKTFRSQSETSRNYWQASLNSSVDFSVHGGRLYLRCQKVDPILDTSDSSTSQDICRSRSDMALSSDSSAILTTARILASRLRACPTTGDYTTGIGSNSDAFWALLDRTTRIEDYEAHQGALVDLGTALVDSPMLQRHELEAQLSSRLDPSGLDVEQSMRKSTIQNHYRLERGFARTAQGLYCNVPFAAKAGDEIIIPSGSTFPMVARRIEGIEPETHQLIGGCVVHGAMLGEMWNPEATTWMRFQ